MKTILNITATILALNFIMLSTTIKERETYTDYIHSLPQYEQSNLPNQCYI